MSELYKRYRPQKLEHVFGQAQAVSTLVGFLQENKVPHALLFSGPSGTGKTTLTRILKHHLECSDHDFVELNCADFKGIEMVRDIRRQAHLLPLGGAVRIWLIDEAHKLTNDAQNALLKILEDTPEHVFFFLCTTDPQKLLRTILTRCTEIKLQSLSSKDLEGLIGWVLRQEQVQLSEDVITALVEAAEGSARKALVLLEQVLGVEGECARLQAIQSTASVKDQSIRLARLLIYPQSTWPEVAAVLKGLEGEDPESLRWMVLGYARAVLLKGGKAGPQAFKVIDIFSRPFYDSKHAGLAAACWEAVMTR